MGFTWTIVGLITGLSVLGYVELAKRYRLDWKAWAGLILGEFLILFCFAWCAASVAEGVPRSASMGLIMFGGKALWGSSLRHYPQRRALELRPDL